MTWADKLKSISAFLAATVIPVVIAFTGNSYSQALKEREIQGQFVGIAVEILAEEPSEHNKNIRTWATTVINSYSGVHLEPAAATDLIERTRISRPRTFGQLDGGSNIALQDLLEWRRQRVDEPRPVPTR